MKLDTLKDDDLTLWQASPVTEIVRDCIKTTYEAQKDQCLSAYWSGKPWSEAELIALRRMESMIDDIFGATLDDLKTVMRQIDGNEESGHSPD